MKIFLYQIKTFAWLGLLTVCLACQSQGQESKGRTKFMRIGPAILQKESSIKFYGKVIDQYRNPVSGVKVTLHVRRFSPNPLASFMAVDDIFVITDKNGDFKLTGKRGLDLGVYGINKQGYEYDRVQTRADYERILKEKPYSRPEQPDSAVYEYGQKPKASNTATPALFYMRKKGEPTFVFHGGGGFVFKAEDSGTEQALDVISRVDLKGNNLKTLMFNNDPVYPDLRAKATWDPKAETWNVELSSGKPGDGFLVLDQKLYEAPADGYLPSFTFQITADNPDKLPLVTIAGNPLRRIQLTYESTVPDSQIMYIYLRSREPAIYTRLIFEYPRNVRQDWLNIGGSIDTNPYGERNLEPVVDLPGGVSRKLEEDIREAFRHSGRPQKPDLPTVVRQWEKSRPLTDRLKDVFKR